MSAVTIIGWMAVCCTTLAFVPQVIKILRTRSAADISLGTFAVMTTGLALWVIYAVIRSDLPLFVGNAVTFCLAGTILVLKLRLG